MAPTNIKTVHQTSFSPYREQPRSTRIVVAYPRPAFSATNRTNTFQPVLINNSKFLKTTHRTKIRKIEIPRSMVVEALSWWSRRASQHPAVQSPVHPWKSPTNLARSPLHVAVVGRNMTAVRDQLFPQKPPSSRFRFSRTGVQHSPGSSTIELPSAFAESGAYPPDRELPGSPRQCSLPLACRPLPKATKLELGRGAHLKTPSSPNHTAAASQPTGRISKAASWLHLSRVSPALLPPERPSHTHTPKPGFGGRGHELDVRCVLVRNIVWDQHDIICYIISPAVLLLCLYGHTYSKSMDQPGKVANPARGQLNRENEYFTVRVRAREIGLARRVWQSRPASACPSPYSGWIWCLLTGFLPSSTAASIYLFKTAIRHRVVSPEFIKVLARDRQSTDWISRTVP